MSGQPVRGPLGSALAGLAAVVVAGAISRAILLAAGFALLDSDVAAEWFALLALAAAVAGGWLAVALVDGVAGRVRFGIAVGVVAAFTVAAALTTLSGGPRGWGSVWQCASLLVGAAVIAWRFRVSDARRA